MVINNTCNKLVIKNILLFGAFKLLLNIKNNLPVLIFLNINIKFVLNYLLQNNGNFSGINKENDTNFKTRQQVKYYFQNTIILTK